MESSTILFIVTLVTLFIFLRWLITPIPQEVPYEVEQITSQNQSRPVPTNNHVRFNSGNSTNDTRSTSNIREITPSMIEIVQAIGPQLTESQIRLDLQRSGSVEATVNNYMENGNLPFPEGESAPQPQPVDSHNIPPSTVSLNLLEKYGLTEDEAVEGTPEETKGKWGASKEERSTFLEKKRKEMILNARKRLASQLSNEKPNVL